MCAPAALVAEEIEVHLLVVSERVLRLALGRLVHPHPLQTIRVPQHAAVGMAAEVSAPSRLRGHERHERYGR